MAAIVAVRELRKRYGAFDALRGVSFEVAAGTIFGLLGPNGAGKTTAIECLLGLRQPDSGDIELCGIDARRHPRAVKARIGAALQTTALQDKLTPREALELFASFYPHPVPTADLLARFALVEKADAAYDTLSGGQRQRLALALAFLNRPEVILLDEPTTGLDPEARQELHAEILQLKRAGHTVLLTTHQLDEAERLCDQIAIIDQGHIVATGAPHDLVGAQARPHQVRLTAAQPLSASLFVGLPDVTALAVNGSRLQGLTLRPEEAVPRLLSRLAESGNALVRLEVDRGSLEDVFLALTRTPERTKEDVR